MVNIQFLIRGAIFICMVYALAFCASDKFADINIAIIDFEGVDLTANEASIVTDKFRYVLLENSSYKIMERSMMQEILKEQGFQQTGACNEASCMVETGHLLGVNYLIAGKVSRADNMLAFSARLIDVKTGQIVMAITNESLNRLSAFVSIDVPVYTRSLIEKMKIYFEEVSKNSQTGLLYVESMPVVGEVFIDEEPTGKITPATFTNIKQGKHKISITDKYLVGADSVFIKPGQVTKVAVKMQKGYASFLIATTPSNAEIFIDDKSIGKSPLTLDSVEAGYHNVTVGLTGFDLIDEEVFFNASQRVAKNYTLSPIGFLKIVDVKHALAISLDSTKFDISTDEIFSLDVGKHTITIKANGCEDEIGNIVIMQGDTVHLSPKLKPRNAELHVTSVPNYATVKISTKTALVGTGRTPSRVFGIPPGHYDLEFNLRKYTPVYKSIDIAPAETLHVEGVFFSYNADYLAWDKKKEVCKNLNWIAASMGDLKVQKSPEGYWWLSAGIASDLLVAASTYQLISHTAKMGAAKTNTEKNYFTSRQTEDTQWLIGSIVASACIRLITYQISNHREY